MSIDYATYPPNWREMRDRVLVRAHYCCEGSPDFPACRAGNHEPHPETGSGVVLTVAHLFEDDLATQDISRLRALCQRCHLHYDYKQRIATQRRNRDQKRGQGELAV